MASLGGDPQDYWFQRPVQSVLPEIQLGLQFAHQQRMDRIAMADAAFTAQLREQVGRGSAELAKAVSDAYSSGGFTAENRAKIYDVARRNPHVMSSPAWKGVEQLLLNTDRADMQYQMLLEKITAQQPTAGIQNAEQVGRWITEANAAYARGDKETGDRLKGQIETITPQAKGFSLETYTDESGHQQVRVTQGIGAGALGAGAASVAQKQLLGIETSLSLLADLGQLRPEDLGVRGVIGEKLDRWLPQIGLGSPDLVRTDNRTKLKATIQQMARQIANDTTNFSNEDRRRAEAVAPSAGWEENAEHANKAISTLKDIFRKRAMINARNLGQKAPDWALTLDEIARKVSSKELSREQAIELIKRYGITE